MCLGAVLLLYGARYVKTAGTEDAELVFGRAFDFSVSVPSEEPEKTGQDAEARAGPGSVPSETAAESAEDESRRIYVHISGAVRNPGVYEMGENDRVFHLIEKAGGFTEEADRGAVNQAAYVHDGEQIRIPCEYEVPEEDGEARDPRININLAGREELMSLPGIGAAKAEAILEYRKKNGSFQKPEDLMNVSGIGESLFEKLRDRIRI